MTYLRSRQWQSWQLSPGLSDSKTHTPTLLTVAQGPLLYVSAACVEVTILGGKSPSQDLLLPPPVTGQVVLLPLCRAQDEHMLYRARPL